MENERIFMRELREEDWVDVHEYASNPVVCKYQPWGPNTVAESKGFVNQVIEDAKKLPRTRFVFGIIEKSNHKLIGAAEFNIRDFTNRNGEIGYIIHPIFWGKGYATEVASFLLNYSFKELNLHRVYATCDPRNIASSRVLEKIGMTLEGKMRQDLLLRDGWRDSLLYSKLDIE